VAQSVSALQVVPQLVPLHLYAPHEAGVPAAQAAVASHLPAGVNVATEQASTPQTVPTAYLRHAPLPLQVPSVPQVAAPWSAHWPRGSTPAGTLLHVPALPDSAHDLQAPAQSVLQQTPWAQNPDWHSVPTPHVAPGGLRPQLPALQVAGAAQSASTEQVVRHWPFVPQTYGVQSWLVALPQVPNPSQRASAVSFMPVHPAGWQRTPAA
jgi:hypothetical protein